MGLSLKHGLLDSKQVTCFVLTISDTRTAKTDDSGKAIVERIEGEGHRLVGYAVEKDDPYKIAFLLRKAVEDTRPDVVITNGGTGIARRDSTFEALVELIERPLPGFGELFRKLSFDEIGPHAMLSRATAGIYKQSLIFALPGSPTAVRLALDKLIIPALPHAVGELKKDR